MQKGSDTFTTILVTGAEGQLGQSFRKVSGHFPEFRFVYSDLPQADITDSNGMEELIRDCQAGIVVNCAAYTAVDRAEAEPETANRINAEGPAVLAEICRSRNIPLVHFSTDFIFDGAATEPYTEHSPANPLNVYGKTKLEGEKKILASGCRALIIRTSWVYSEFGNNFVKTMLRLGNEKREVSVVDDQKGNPTYAGDLAKAAMELVSGGIAGTGIYNFSNEGAATTWFGFACEIFRMANMDVKVKAISAADYSSPAKRPVYSVLSKKKIASEGITVPEWKTSLNKCITILCG